MVFWVILILLLVISIWYLFFQSKKNKLRVRVEGFVNPKFEKVQQVFREHFESGLETGGAFAVYYKGELVVDLWGGYVNQEGRIPWRENTMSTAFSVSKGMNALLVAKFVELGYLDYKQLVSHYWPEFGKNGKEAITVEMLLSHQGGLIGFDKPLSYRLSVTDRETYLSYLENQRPFWEPGTKFGYHMLSWGYYVDALLMKVDPKKRTLDRIFQEEIAEPFGIDFFQGVPTHEIYRMVPRFYVQSLWHSLCNLADRGTRSRLKYAIVDPKGYQTIAKRACAEFVARNPLDKITDYEIRQVPCTSFNGHGTARGIAKLFGIVSNGGVHENKTLLKESTIKNLDNFIVQGDEVVIGTQLKIGYGLIIAESPAGNLMFGHNGYGGQMGAGDLKHQIGMGYLTNNMNYFAFDDPRYLALREAFYDCLLKET